MNFRRVPEEWGKHSDERRAARLDGIVNTLVAPQPGVCLAVVVEEPIVD